MSRDIHMCHRLLEFGIAAVGTQQVEARDALTSVRAQDSPALK